MIFFDSNLRILAAFFLILAISSDFTEAKILTQCQVVSALNRAGIPGSLHSNWICLIKYESGFSTRLVSGPKTQSSYSYGILQINSMKWCARGRAGGICKKKCEDFVANDDIEDDVACAKQIYDSMGFMAWDGWVKNCKNKILPRAPSCRV